jgi:nucleoside triphosphate diphosphatase
METTCERWRYAFGTPTMRASRMPQPHQIERLLEIMAALRDPKTGCPWDVEQTFASIARYTVEEAYEVADAIQRNDLVDLKDELGDLLLQVVFHARIAEEQGLFDFTDVVEAIAQKMVRRHPHVFGDAQKLPVEQVNALWDRIKHDEKAQRRLEREKAGLPPEEKGFLHGIPAAFPALTRAQKLTTKAAKVGFDWPEASQVIAKIHEELEEVREAAASSDPVRIEDEMGDLLFAAANLARHYGIDPEAALRRTNAKFERRFQAIETGLAKRNRTLEEADLEEMERLWQEAKSRDR